MQQLHSPCTTLLYCLRGIIKQRLKCLMTAVALQTKRTVGFLPNARAGISLKTLTPAGLLFQVPSHLWHQEWCPLWWLSMRKPPQQKASAQSEQCITLEISCHIHPMMVFITAGSWATCSGWPSSSTGIRFLLSHPSGGTAEQTLRLSAFSWN